MKMRLTLIAFLFAFMPLAGQVHVTVENPSEWSAEELRPFIGQTVVFDVPMVVCANANGNYTVSPWRRFHPESHGFAGTDDYSETVRINNTCMFKLTGVSGYHRCGEKIDKLTATVTSVNTLVWKSGTWHGNTRADLEKALPELGDYRLLVCGFNLENYFAEHIGSEYLGADSYSEHRAQRTKVSKALSKINADIYGLVELEQGNTALKEITDDLNAALPMRNYRYFHDATVGSNQKTDFVYDANVVEPVGTPAETNVELQYKKKMICFREIATGEKFIFSANHFKSMNTGDEYRRVNEAKAVIKLYNSYRQNARVKENDLLIMGDLNCYAFTEPVKVFTDNRLIDLHRAFHADSSYSYMFSNLASYIDHAICNETLYRQITGMAAYHINSDEDDAFTYDKSSDNTMFRCSDHDPVLVGLRLDSLLSRTFQPYFNGAEMAADSLSFYYVYTSEDAPVVYFDLYTLNGTLLCPPTRIIYNGDIFEKHTKYYTLSDKNPDLPDEIKRFMPLQPGLYILHFYFNGTITSHKLIVR